LKIGVEEEHEMIQKMIVKEDTILDLILSESIVGNSSEKAHYIAGHMGELLSEFIPDQYLWFRHDLEPDLAS
jgi:hypothetical protein